jgi:hypothetical protein
MAYRKMMFVQVNKFNAALKILLHPYFQFMTRLCLQNKKQKECFILIFKKYRSLSGGVPRAGRNVSMLLKFFSNSCKNLDYIPTAPPYFEFLGTPLSFRERMRNHLFKKSS